MIRYRRESPIAHHGPGRCLLAVTTLIVAAGPASAQILTRTTQRPSENWSPLLPLTVGGGFEFQTDHGETEYNFPLLLQYNFTEFLKLSAEPNITYLVNQGKHVAGLGDLETSVEWEFLRERRYRPALTAGGVIRWPTATASDLGSPGWDYGVGMVASKNLVYVDLDLGALYTFSGDPDQQDILELSLAGEYPLNHRLAIEFEFVASFGGDILFGQPAEPSGSGKDFEGTLGLGWRANNYLKLEQGFTLRSDGTWQVIFGWTWNFAGED
jgi:hypothetical protein